MSPAILRKILLACAVAAVTLTSASAQTFRHWEAGLHLSRLDVDSLHEAPLGGGARISYYLNPSFAIEAEATRYFEDPSHNFGHSEFVAGARYGYWFGPLGLFVKARPGIFILGGNAATQNPGRENNFAINVGGAVLLGRGRVGIRIDAGDTAVFWGDTPFRTGLPATISGNNRELNLGFVVRF